MTRSWRHATLLAAFVAILAVSGAMRAQTSDPPADRFVIVNGLRLHYLDWGTEGRPPLILIHGLDRIARTFDHVAPHFRARYHVLAIDMRGHGDSDWDDQARYRVEDHVGDLKALVDRLGLTNVTLWGNSTGGRVAQVFAGTHPQLVSRVIAEDVGPERPRQIADSYEQRVKQEEMGWESEENLLARLRGGTSPLPDAVLLPYVRHGTKRRADGRFVWKRDPKLVKGFVATDLWPAVSRIAAPILYVLGGRSTIVPPATQEALKARLPRVTIVTMPGLGHYPSDEDPAGFLAIVDEFLAATAR